MLVTEEWLLSDVQVRNPGMTRNDYEALFAEWLGIRRTIWLGDGCAGDDTHGHVDDIARFVARDTVVIAVEPDPSDDNHDASRWTTCAGSNWLDRIRLGPLRRGAPAVSAHGRHDRRTASGELRQLLHRQRRGDGADVQRRQRPAGAQHAGRS